MFHRPSSPILREQTWKPLEDCLSHHLSEIRRLYTSKEHTPAAIHALILECDNLFQQAPKELNQPLHEKFYLFLANECDAERECEPEKKQSLREKITSSFSSPGTLFSIQNPDITFRIYALVFEITKEDASLENLFQLATINPEQFKQYCDAFSQSPGPFPKEILNFFKKIHENKAKLPHSFSEMFSDLAAKLDRIILTRGDSILGASSDEIIPLAPSQHRRYDGR